MSPFYLLGTGFLIGMGCASFAAFCIGWKHSAQARQDGYQDGLKAGESAVRRKLQAMAESQPPSAFFTRRHISNRNE